MPFRPLSCRYVVSLLLLSMLTGGAFSTAWSDSGPASVAVTPTDAAGGASSALPNSPTGENNQLFQPSDRQQYLSLVQLRRQKVIRLRHLADDLARQRQLVSDFEGYVSWMNANLAAYSRYIQAGSAAAAVTKFLPIPYAGQASLFTKFVAQFSLSLGSASKSLNGYLQTSHQLLQQIHRLDPNRPDTQALTETARYADTQFLKAMQETQQRLTTVSDLSSGTLAFLEGLGNYLAAGDEYLDKLKGVFKKEHATKERSFVADSAAALKGQASRFNNRLRGFDELGMQATNDIKSFAVYDELETLLLPATEYKTIKD